MANVSLVRALSNGLALRTKAPTNLQSPDSRGGWVNVVREPFAGAWQANISTPLVDVLTHPTVFSCVTLIANDVSKMRCELVVEQDDDVWETIENPAFSPVLRMPNGYQTQLQFFRSWFLSLLTHGNTYILKSHDLRGVVTRMYVLYPRMVRPLVAPDGSVFYELKRDALSTQTDESVIVPASEIIHDLVNPLFHPLVGISPLYASGVAAILGLKIQTNSTKFFANGSQPGGILTAPGAIDALKAKAMKEQWETNFGGDNTGRVAVLGDGLTYQALGQPADKSQLNEQWASASEAIANAFHVPWYLVGGPLPNYANIQAQTVQYFTQCIQPLAISCEQVLDKGLGLAPDKINGQRYGTQFNVNDLLWMDSSTMMTVQKEGVAGGILTPNEARAALNRAPKDGGETPYLQSQWVPLGTTRDAANPAAPPQAQLPAAPPAAPPEDMPAADMAAAFAIGMRTRGESHLQKRLAA